MELTRENYFETHEYNGIPILSNSLLKYAMPVFGGNSYRIQAAYEDMIEKKDSPAKKLGSLLHEYSRDPNQFIFQPDWEMSDNIQFIVDYVYENVSSTLRQASLSDHADMITEGAEQVNYGQSWKDETVVKKVVEAGTGYWLFLQEAEGKIPLHGSQLEQMKNMINALEGSLIGCPVLHDPTECDYFAREVPHLFFIDGEYPCKILMDAIEVNTALGLATIHDTKTTGDKIENFFGSYGYAPKQAKGGEWYIDRVERPGAYVKYGYFSQEFLYLKGAQDFLKKKFNEDFKVDFQFNVVETSAPYCADSFVPSDVWRHTQMTEFHQAMVNVSDWFKRNRYGKF